jgi:hypothetical protein
VFCWCGKMGGHWVWQPAPTPFRTVIHIQDGSPPRSHACARDCRRFVIVCADWNSDCGDNIEPTHEWITVDNQPDREENMKLWLDVFRIGVALLAGLFTKACTICGNALSTEWMHAAFLGNANWYASLWLRLTGATTVYWRQHYPDYSQHETVKTKGLLFFTE